jgi:hypothetical protein
MQRERAGSSAVVMLASQASVCVDVITMSAERARGRGFKSRPVHSPYAIKILAHFEFNYSSLVPKSVVF